MTLSDTLRRLKANSSKWIHNTFETHQSFAWQSGHSAFSVSESQSTKVHRYIENQEDHHKKMTFEQELKALLKAHGIAFDPRHL